MNGVVEVQWPGDTTFKTILEDSSHAARRPMTATLTQVGVGGSSNGGWVSTAKAYGEGVDAVLCDLSAKKCTE